MRVRNNLFSSLEQANIYVYVVSYIMCKILSALLHTCMRICVISLESIEIWLVLLGISVCKEGNEHVTKQVNAVLDAQ